MGYGGSRQDAGKAIGKSGDGGIDGIIKEDKLGLYSGPRNLDSMISYTWGLKRGGPSGTHAQAVSAGL